jgi:hypothetical protein
MVQNKCPVSRDGFFYKSSMMDINLIMDMVYLAGILAGCFGSDTGILGHWMIVSNTWWCLQWMWTTSSIRGRGRCSPNQGCCVCLCCLSAILGRGEDCQWSDSITEPFRCTLPTIVTMMEAKRMDLLAMRAR